MQRLRLYDLLTSSFPEKIGECADNVPAVAAAANECERRLLIADEQPDEGLFGTWARMAFEVKQTDPYITFPRSVARATALDICKRPVAIKNQWYEFLAFGTGLRPLNCSGKAICENMEVWERGDYSSLVVTHKDLTPPNKRLRFYATDPTDVDANKRVLTQGLDSTGATIYSLDGDIRTQGIFTELTAPFADTDRDISKLTGLQKDITNGAVQIFQVDTITSVETLLLTMEPGEQVASYPRLFLNGLPNSCCGTSTIQVVVMVKLEHIPVVVPTDYLLLQSLDAFIEEAQSVRFAAMDIPSAKGMSEQHHARALKYLFGQLDHYVGKERISISVPLFGSDRLRPSPI